MHQQSHKSHAIATAVDAFAKGGLPDLFYNLARAINKGHLQSTHFIAQHLKSIGYNLCQDNTNSWRFLSKRGNSTACCSKLIGQLTPSCVAQCLLEAFQVTIECPQRCSMTLFSAGKPSSNMMNSLLQTTAS